MRRIAIADWLFVPGCGACDERLPPGQALCATCAVSLYPLTNGCPGCAQPIDGPVAVTCRRCRRRPLPLEQMSASFRYGGELAVALQRLKYQRRAELAKALAPLFRAALMSAIEGCDTVVPVPLHWRRQAARGFNQSLLLARAAAPKAMIDGVSLRRVRGAEPQARLGRGQRAGNLADAFVVARRRQRRVEGRRILLFDDVITTGTTMAACARALLAAGATAVRGFAVARAE